MGGGGLLGGLIGGLLGSGEKPKPSPSPVPAQSIEEEKRKAKTSRAALFETEGGAAGEELNDEEIKKRQTLLGN